MADTKISALSLIDAIADADEFPIVDKSDTASAATGTTKRATGTRLKSYLGTDNFETSTQLNARDTANRARGNHTGTQLASTISDFSTAADARIAASNKVGSDPTGVSGADQITNMMSLTQAEYDAIGTPNASTLYVVTD